ncbi:MAG: DEAD/DEAH box helicase [Planctomycetes bacterium]|nr:DEAD/DEAH box helicase [Planctomycetota bacterium]
MAFEKLMLIEPLLRAIRGKGYAAPTPIQAQALPPILEGHDLLGCAQTGTGKTAAFALPILQRLHHHVGSHAPQEPHAPRGGGKHYHPRARHERGPVRPIRALILSPTRELAAQIGDSFTNYGRHTGLRHTVIFGGVKQGSQVAALRKGVDILVATPGRLLDLINQGFVKLDQIEIFVLDEADRMLDMGFIHDIRKVVAMVPAERQTLLFSATMPREIRSLADSILRKPVTITIAAQSAAADTVHQVVYRVEQPNKPALLEHLLADPAMSRTIIFARTKRGADRIVRRLNYPNFVAEAIHSDKSQAARLKALHNFKKGMTRVLVASDIAARGLDVDQISHVINYDMPNDAETYVHRIGRTGRAGQQGHAISFCSEEERGSLRDVERMLKRPLEVIVHGFNGGGGSPAPVKKERVPHPLHQGQGQGQGQGQNRGHKNKSGRKPRPEGHPDQKKAAFWKGRPKKKGRRPSGGKDRSTGAGRRRGA